MVGGRTEYQQKMGHTARCTIAPYTVAWQCKLVSGWGLRKRRSEPHYMDRIGLGKDFTFWVLRGLPFMYWIKMYMIRSIHVFALYRRRWGRSSCRQIYWSQVTMADWLTDNIQSVVTVSEMDTSTDRSCMTRVPAGRCQSTASFAMYQRSGSDIFLLIRSPVI